MIAGSRSFAAIGQWAADAGPEVLDALGAACGPAQESLFRRVFAVVSADVLDQLLGTWLWTRAVRAGGRLVIAIDGRTVRGAKGKDRKAPQLVAALAHGIGGPRPGRRGREEQRDPRGPGTAGNVRRPGRHRHHDRRAIYAK